MKEKLKSKSFNNKTCLIIELEIYTTTSTYKSKRASLKYQNG